MKLKIKKGDTVVVNAGASKGVKGAVMAINPLKLKIKVQGANIQTHFDKKEGILKSEDFIDYSNVTLVEKAAKQAKAAKKASSAKSKDKS